MKKKIAFIMSAALLGAVFTGCGDSDSSSSSKAAASTKASASEEASEGETEAEGTTEASTEEETEKETEEETTEEETTEAETEAETADKAAPAEGDELFLGKWACSEMEVDGQVLTEMPLFNIPLEAFINAEIRDDGTIKFDTGVIGMNTENKAEDNICTWEKVDDHTIKVPVNNSEIALVEAKGEYQLLTFEGDTFSFSGESEGKTATIRFKRVDEFPTYDMSALMQQMSEAFEGLGEELTTSE